MKKLFLEAEVKAINTEEGNFEVVASNGKVDRIGDTIDPKGWYLNNYKKNPVMLWAHNQFSPPIAQADSVWIEGDKELRVKGHFADTPFAQEIKQLVVGGFLRAVSVGFMPLVEDQKGSVDIEGKMYRRMLEEELKEYTEKGWHGREGTKFTKQELLEVSWVNVPALASALVSAGKKNLQFPVMSKALEDLQKDVDKEDEKDKQEEKKIELEKTSKSIEEKITGLEEAINTLKDERKITPDKSVTSTEVKGRKQNFKAKTADIERLVIIFDKFCEILLKKLRQKE